MAARKLPSQLAEPPAAGGWKALRDAAANCRACPLWRDATQTVFGEGPARATVMFVGEQPGDSEDQAGRPFVGPAGKLLDRALIDAGIERTNAYVTNAVKHFKWKAKGKRRLHQKPDAGEISACRPWLGAEIKLLRPRVLVCLGGTAAKSVFGHEVRVLRERGKGVVTEFCANTVVTVHPSSLLRAPDEAARRKGYADFLQDLKVVARLLKR